MPTITRTGFTSVSTAIVSVANDMLANGFTQVFPSSGAVTVAEPAGATTFNIAMAATTKVDTLATTQPWSVNFSVGTTQTVSMFIATPLQINGDGTVTEVFNGIGNSVYNYAGAVGTPINTQVPNPSNPSTGFFNRGSRQSSNSQGSYPIAYMVSFTNRGFALAMWEEASDDLAAIQSWVVVQRPVDRITGAPLTAGKTPLFCVNCVNNNFWKFVVCESDIQRPTNPLAADSTSVNSTAVINSIQQISIDESGEYVITFPCRLNTQRYAYTQEMDMLGYTSANVISAGAPVPVTVYGESTARTYTALFANGQNDTNMRILFLSNGGGI